MNKTDQPVLNGSLRVIRIETLCEKLQLSRSWIYQQVALDQFPRPISLGTRAVGWLEHEIDQWVEDRTKASRLNAEESQNG